jgi:ABC-type oligopeptide transport system ATPase subunit
MATPLLEVRHLVKQFSRRDGFSEQTDDCSRVNDVTFTVDEAETFGLVGESGSGKTTTGRCILRLIEPTSEKSCSADKMSSILARRTSAIARRNMQIVFQDPYSSLNPRMRVRQIVEEPSSFIRSYSSGRRDRVVELFRWLGSILTTLERYPHEFSGGQRQRIGVARRLP